MYLTRLAKAGPEEFILQYGDSTLHPLYQVFHIPEFGSLGEIMPMSKDNCLPMDLYWFGLPETILCGEVADLTLIPRIVRLITEWVQPDPVHPLISLARTRLTTHGFILRSIFPGHPPKYQLVHLPPPWNPHGKATLVDLAGSPPDLTSIPQLRFKLLSEFIPEQFVDVYGEQLRSFVGLHPNLVPSLLSV